MTNYRVYIRKINTWVDVTKEQYYAYYRDVWATRKREQFYGRCRCPKSKMWICDGDCLSCAFHATGEIASLDSTFEDDEGNSTSQIEEHAHVFTTSSGNHKIPVVTSKGTASWIDEEGAIPESDDVFGQQMIGAHKVGTLIKVSEELLNDSAFDLEGYFASEFARRIGNKEEDAFFNGNGAGKPLGILAATGSAQVGVTAASATAVTADEIIDLFYSLEAPYRKNAIWVLNDASIAAIRKLKDNNGQYLWQPALHEGTYDTLLGKRIFTSPFVPEMKSGKKSVIFGDLSFYWIGDRQGITFKRLNERYADTGQIGFIATKRLDGKLILPEAVKVLQQKGAASSGS